MIDAVRGVLRVRKWPRKRGPPRSAAQAFWVDWFKQANLLAKYADGMSQVRAKQMAQGSGMYPRDILLKAMRGRLYTWVDTTGWRWFSVAAIQDISESLDVLAQTVGSVLVRAADRWRAPAPGTINDVLTYKGDATPPVWQTPGGGVSQGVLVGTPIVPDGTVNQYVLDLTPYVQIELMLDLIGYAASDRADVRFSTDGGSTYHAGAADYVQIFNDKNTSAANQVSQVALVPAPSVGNHVSKAKFANLRAGRQTHNVAGGTIAVGSGLISGFANFDGPITHMKIYTRSGNNFNAGTIRGVGF